MIVMDYLWLCGKGLDQRRAEMITKNTLRLCVSPVVAFTFAVVSITGILMMFDINHVEDLHQWMGLAFALAGAMHLAVHWRALVANFHSRRIFVWGAAMLLICAVLLIGIGDGDRDIDDVPKSKAIEQVKDLHD
jgi:Na+/melibiose symporter-like transporter